jgi:hypothetical protein
VVPNLIKESWLYPAYNIWSFKMEKWAKVSIGRPFQGKPGLMTIELSTGLGQVYRENQYVSDVSYRIDVREEAGGLKRIWGYVEIVGGIQDQFGYGDEFTLRLDNGQPIEIVIKTLDFNSGEKRDIDETRDKRSIRVPH